MAEGAPIFVIDNLKTDLVSPAFAAALTTSTYKGRILGASQSVTGRIEWSWVVTANNPVVDNDIARRCIRIRLVPKVEEPWLLPPDVFPIPDIDAWVVEHEVALTEAVLTLVRAWVRAGMPARAKTLGSYKAWSRVLGGILTVAEIPGFLGNLHELFTTRPTPSARRGGRWCKRGGPLTGIGKSRRAPSTSSPQRHDIDVRVSGKDDAGRSRSFGLRLKSQSDRIYDGLSSPAPAR